MTYYGSPESPEGTVTYGYIQEIHCRKHFSIESSLEQSLQKTLEKESYYQQLSKETYKIINEANNKDLNMQKNKKLLTQTIPPSK